MLAILMVATAVVLLVLMKFSNYVVITCGGIALLLYFYVIYKRYHVEVVPERDVVLFEDKEDLQILCEIYGLETAGSHGDLRRRLIGFAKEHEKEAFTWVAPKAIISFGSTLAATEPEPQVQSSVLDQLLKETDAELIRSRGLVFGLAKKRPVTKTLKACPICDAKPPRSITICPKCGADLEFYTSLSESKVGRRMVKRKARTVSRKLRVEVPPLAGLRQQNDP